MTANVDKFAAEIESESLRYNINRIDAFRDWVLDSPTDRELALAVAEKVGLLSRCNYRVTIECINRNCCSIDEVNTYERELYDN